MEARERAERLREAAALGDVGEVQQLLQRGAAVNAQNEVNGWTCLHWACKRNHADVVSCLIDAGADKLILTARGELAAQLTAKKEIRKIMGVDENEFQEVKDLNLPIVANYLANTPFPYVHSKESRSSIPAIPTAPQNESTSDSFVSQCEATNPCSSASQVESVSTPTSSQGEDGCPALDSKEGQPTPSAAIMMSEYPPPRVQSGPLCQPSMSHNRGLFSPVASISQQQNGSYTGAAPTFQPLFFTGTFPSNMQEFRTLGKNDFQDLLRVSCCELGVNPEHVEKIRKLPNTLVRKVRGTAIFNWQENCSAASGPRSPARLPHASCVPLSTQCCAGLSGAKSCRSLGVQPPRPLP
uniref:Ankyrin repeat domain-containing protein 40 n=1 Tax=Pelusios castaneus TaxID=367368 RepID=A0A8C8R7E1_9SAUR